MVWGKIYFTKFSQKNIQNFRMLFKHSLSILVALHRPITIVSSLNIFIIMNSIVDQQQFFMYNEKILNSPQREINNIFWKEYFAWNESDFPNDKLFTSELRRTTLKDSLFWGFYSFLAIFKRLLDQLFDAADKVKLLKYKLKASYLNLWNRNFRNRFLLLLAPQGKCWNSFLNSNSLHKRSHDCLSCRCLSPRV